MQYAVIGTKWRAELDSPSPAARVVLDRSQPDYQCAAIVARWHVNEGQFDESVVEADGTHSAIFRRNR
jgi:hypothetical protein